MVQKHIVICACLIGSVVLLAIPADANAAQLSEGNAAANGVNLPPRQRGKIILVEEDLPPTAVVARREGKVKVEFTVGTNGRVTECRTVITSRFWQIDELTCYLIQRRARYYPATDANGNPISAKADQSVTWVLPEANYVAFFRDYSERSFRGDLDAMVALGMLYESGYGTTKDYGAAVSWYRKAADSGHAEAMYRLGRLHLGGFGVDQNEISARQLFELAAKNGDRSAAIEISELDRKNEAERFAASPEGKRQAAQQAAEKAARERRELAEAQKRPRIVQALCSGQITHGDRVSYNIYEVNCQNVSAVKHAFIWATRKLDSQGGEWFRHWSNQCANSFRQYNSIIESGRHVETANSRLFYFCNEGLKQGQVK